MNINTLRLDVDISTFTIPPVFYTELPNYTISDDPQFKGLLSLEAKFKSTPIVLISYDEIVEAVLRINNIRIDNFHHKSKSMSKCELIIKLVIVFVIVKSLIFSIHNYL